MVGEGERGVESEPPAMGGDMRTFDLEKLAVILAAKSMMEPWVWEQPPYTQGHLVVRPIRPGNSRFESTALHDSPFSRRMLDHVISGKFQIFTVEEKEASLTWLLLVADDGVRIFSAGHTPLQLEKGWYVATHTKT